MPRMLSSREVIRILLEHGFVLVSQKGSHQKYRHQTGRTVIVPHPRKDIPRGTMRSIIRQSGLEEILFE
ncbi:MAG: type II toxin-antitoxin system HicA family toxin [Verrucomicrobiae bacterium]|nr:type II toxin-antitoxin system HicA family toxin [Verrucomicrobiae bacterium]